MALHTRRYPDGAFLVLFIAVSRSTGSVKIRATISPFAFLLAAIDTMSSADTSSDASKPTGTFDLHRWSLISHVISPNLRCLCLLCMRSRLIFFVCVFCVCDLVCSCRSSTRSAGHHPAILPRIQRKFWFRGWWDPVVSRSIGGNSSGDLALIVFIIVAFPILFPLSTCLDMCHPRVYFDPWRSPRDLLNHLLHLPQQTALLDIVLLFCDPLHISLKDLGNVDLLQLPTWDPRNRTTSPGIP